MIRLKPDDAESHYQIGKICSLQGQLRLATNEFERAIAINPDHDGAYNALAKLYLRAGDKAKAEALLAALSARKRQRQDSFEQRVAGH